jgi:hypothetical protein
MEDGQGRPPDTHMDAGQVFSQRSYGFADGVPDSIDASDLVVEELMSLFDKLGPDQQQQLSQHVSHMTRIAASDLMRCDATYLANTGRQL